MFNFKSLQHIYTCLQVFIVDLDEYLHIKSNYSAMNVEILF